MQLANKTEQGTATFRHKKSDKRDRAANIDAAKRLNKHGFSVVIRGHQRRYKTPNPELTIIDRSGMAWRSDLKTPDPSAYKSIQGGIRNSFRSARDQSLTHLVIDIIGNESLDDIADGLGKAFALNAQIQRVIVLRKGQAVEMTRGKYLRGKLQKELKRGLQ